MILEMEDQTLLFRMERNLLLPRKTYGIIYLPSITTSTRTSMTPSGHFPYPPLRNKAKYREVSAPFAHSGTLEDLDIYRMFLIV